MMDCAYPKLVFEYIAPTLYKYRVEMSLPDGKVFVLNIKDCERPLSTKEQETLAIRAYHEANGMAMPTQAETERNRRIRRLGLH